ncbi:MAG: methyltransferase type 12 [Rhodospirillaceae bacterium]|nr:methyltransferase type 12 [Rhodospirillaceae bacterium]
MLPIVQQPFQHDLMPIPDHDEHAREDFTVSLKLFMSEHIYPYDETIYEKRAKKKFVKQHSREPKNCTEIHRLMMQDPYTKFWSSIARNLQETLWDTQGRIVERQLNRITEVMTSKTTNPIGTLTIDPDFQMPRYIDAIDIHAMPGGYQTSLSETDVFAGAVFDRGAYYYTKGMVGPMGEGGGDALIMAVKKYFPNLKPRRVLDLGCAIGWTTTPLVDAFPDAEIYGIDVGAAILRYGHGRAEALGKKIHFRQENGENTSFPSEYFDLVLSGGVFHETSKKASEAIITEMHRVLKPDGVCMNYDIPYGGDYNLHSQFMLNWDSYYNAEPFWKNWTAIDRTQFMSSGGFKESRVIESWADRDLEGNFTFFADAFDKLHPSARGGIGRVHFFGAHK